MIVSSFLACIGFASFLRWVLKGKLNIELQAFEIQQQIVALVERDQEKTEQVGAKYVV
jgi:hypothetical protein